MNFVNQFTKQVSDLFRSMTPGSRITVGLLFCVLVVGVAFLFTGQVIQSDEYLFGGESFSVSQIQNMEAAFATEGLSGTKIEGSKIKIEGNKQPYIAALVKHNALPPGCYDAFREAIDETSVFQLPSVVDAKLQSGRSNELTQWVLKLPNIEWARVMYSKEKTQGFSRQDKCSATIAVGPVLGETINAKQAKAIRLMAAGYLCIPANDITVTDVRAIRSFSGDLEQGDLVNGELKADYEASWENKIRELLNIPGMTVAINVELDPYKARKEFVVTPDTRPVTKDSYEKTNKLESSAPTPMGRPGFSANQPNQIAQTGSQNSTKTEKDSETISNNVVGGRNAEFIYASGRPERVNVSICIPSDYFVKIWESRNPTPEGEDAKTPTAAELATIETEEIAKKKQAVANLLRSEGVQDASELVNITSSPSFAPTPVEAPGMMAQATGWLGKYWTVLGLFVLAFLSLRVLRSVMRGVPIEIGDANDGSSSANNGTKNPGTVPDEKSKAAASEMLRRFEVSANAPSLREELTMLVNQDTDAAATILRTWIGNPSMKG